MYGEWNNKKKQDEQQQLQIQDQMSAYSWKTTHDLFVMMTEFLEKYIEVAGYYPDWQSRKQIHDNRVQRKDKNLEEAENSFSTMLYLFGTNVVRKPEFHEKLKEEYYQWINSTRIDVSNCPPRLKYVLFGVSEILEGRGEKIKEDVKNAKETYDVNSPEYDKSLNEVFADMQIPLDNEEKTLKSLKGKNWKQITLENKFSGGNSEKGEDDFKRIKSTISLSDYQKNFHFFPQKDQKVSVSQGKLLTEKVKQNLNEWSIEEVVVFEGYYGGRGEKRELALVHKEANLKRYNLQGYLEIDPRMTYFKKDHQPEEWVQIEQYYSNKVGTSSVSQSNNPQQCSNSEIIQDVKNNPQNWRIDEVITEYNVLGGAKKKEKALIHQSAEVGNDGEVFGGNQPVYLAKRFNQAELAEINQSLDISQTSSTGSSQYFNIAPKVSEVRQLQKTNNPIDTGGILAIIGVVSVLTIGSVVVVKKRLNKKVKK